MAANHGNVLRLVPPPSDMGRLLAQALVDLHKAVKGAGFYPEGHPHRTAPLKRAFDALERLVQKRELSLTVTRQGFAPGLDGADGNQVLLQLARECLMRRISGITFTRSLVPRDLRIFVELLGEDPQKSISLGGFGRQLEGAGVRTITVQERDSSAVWRKITAARGGAAAGAGCQDLLNPALLGSPEPAPRYSIAELLRLMAHEPSDSRYQQLGHELVERFPRELADFAVLPALEELLRQHEDQQKTVPQREYALFTLERLAEEKADLLLDSLQSRGCTDKEGILRVMAALGGKGAYRIIQRICLAEEVYQRKALAAALVRLGSAATGPVLAMLRDERWYVVRNMVAILGELRCSDVVVALRKPLYHQDQRVRKETVRALMKIGGDLAEATLIGLIEDQDQGIARHAVMSLGLMHSRLAVSPLLKVLERRDLLLKMVAVKKEIILALGRIGDRRAASALVKILGSRRFPALGRRLELKMAAASALGSLGDDSVLTELAGFAAGIGPLSEACREAMEALERVTGGGEAVEELRS